MHRLLLCWDCSKDLYILLTGHLQIHYLFLSYEQLSLKEDVMTAFALSCTLQCIRGVIHHCSNIIFSNILPYHNIIQISLYRCLRECTISIRFLYSGHLSISVLAYSGICTFLHTKSFFLGGHIQSSGQKMGETAEVVRWGLAFVSLYSMVVN